ncbi:MAG: ABC transporter substrate-binding protein [Ilumatobacteraceae bacterium]
MNTSCDQEWSNYISTVANLSAEVVDDRTVTVTSEVPDPRLPAVGIYILPKHIWEEQATPETIDSYDGLDGVGSGPFTISDYQSEESLTMTANPNYYDGQPAVDTLIFRYFANPDAMVAAIQRGEIDAAQGIPASSFETLDADPDIVAVAGLQGGFDEIAFNGGAAEGQPHPALLDLGFRQALNMAIDKEGATEDLWFGLAEPATAVSMAADLAWVPEILTEEQLTYDPEAVAAARRARLRRHRRQRLPRDARRWRRHRAAPRRQHRLRSSAAPSASCGSNWMNAIGIQVELEAYDQDQLYGVGSSTARTTPLPGLGAVRRSRPDAVVLHRGRTRELERRQLVRPRVRTLYTEQNQEIDLARRQEIVHEMVRSYDAAAHPALWYTPDLQAYRTDRFEDSSASRPRSAR